MPGVLSQAGVRYLAVALGYEPAVKLKGKPLAVPKNGHRQKASRKSRAATRRRGRRSGRA